MDLWETFPHKAEFATDEVTKNQIIEWTEWWNNDVAELIKNKIVPLLEWARRNEIPIIFSNILDEGWDRTLSPLLNQDMYNEPIINRTHDLYAYLTGLNVGTIYYSGVAINNCILGKPTGMTKMHEAGFKVALIEDAALSGEGQIMTEEDALTIMEEQYDADFITMDELKSLYRESQEQ